MNVFTVHIVYLCWPGVVRFCTVVSTVDWLNHTKEHELG